MMGGRGVMEGVRDGRERGMGGRGPGLDWQ